MLCVLFRANLTKHLLLPASKTWGFAAFFPSFLAVNECSLVHFALLTCQSSWLTLSAGHILDSSPPVDDHGAVVVNVKERHLAVLLPQDEEELPGGEERYTSRCSHSHWNVWTAGTYRVTELHDLGQETPPADSGHLEGASGPEVSVTHWFNDCTCNASNPCQIWAKCVK